MNKYTPIYFKLKVIYYKITKLKKLLNIFTLNS